MRSLFTALCAGLSICAVGAATQTLHAQTAELSGDLPGCSAGTSSVTLTYSGVDVRVLPVGARLNCNTTIIVKGGDFIADGQIDGLKPSGLPRPDGHDGKKSYSLSIVTQCGRRELVDVFPIDRGRGATSRDDVIDAGNGTITPVTRTYCGNIHINARVNLAGEYGTAGRDADSAGTGFAGGNGGSGGNFSATGVNDININALVDTSGGAGGNGGNGGPDTSCEASGQGNGGWGSSGGAAGSISLKHSGAPNTAVIRIGSGINRGLVAVGGSAGNGGYGTPGAQHGCGATAGVGGSAANGQPGGKVSISGYRVESSVGYYYGYPIPVISNSGGYAGHAGRGSSGGSVLCFRGLSARGPNCPPPVNGGAAGNAGSGGAAGGTTIKAGGTPLGANDLGTLQGSVYIVSLGGGGGIGNSGGNGGAQVDNDCDLLCCGSGGFSQAGDFGGAGGIVAISATRIALSVTADLVGGSGGSGTHGSTGGCGPCDGEQGGLGGAGGAGGSLSFAGPDPFAQSALFYNIFGGNGGNGGQAGPGGPAAPGGAAGSPGTVTNTAVPPAPEYPYGYPGIPGVEGEDGFPCPNP